ncbi:MAG: thiol reductant ABC exporter subunit CydC [Solobacterium sp.]|nr:thiol reductant ABC exporter subunit CydC [Solobacterium sp.]
MKKYRYSTGELTARLLKIGSSIRGYLIVSTLASIIGNLSHMGLMGFGAMWVLCACGYASGSTAVYAVLTALSGLLIAVCRYLEGVYSHKGAYGVLAAMRVDLFRTIDRISPAFLVERKMGDILNIAVSDIETLEFFFAHTIGPMFTVILLPVTSVLLAMHFSRLFGIILIPFYILVSAVIPTIALMAGKGIGIRYRTSLGELKSVILESVYGIRDLQIFNAGRRKEEEMLKANEEVSRAAHGLVLHRQTVSSLPNLFVYLARIAIILTATYLASIGEGDPAGTIVVSFAAAASFSSTFSLTFVVSHLLEAFASAQRLFLIEDTEPLVKEADDPVNADPIDEIRFEGVSFAYPSASDSVLEHLYLTVHKGEHIGLIGESGAGKSTILRLLLRFYDPDQGKILINGIDEKEISLSSLHDRIALLEQDTYLFNLTIAENIAVSKPDASMEEIREAAARAGIADFIETLPDGYDTQMGEMSARLSGGERQRIGIARVLLKDPDVIIMDEPTSSLDVLHEKELLHTLNKEYRDAAVIVISHRMSSLSGCRKIYRLEDKKLVPYPIPDRAGA